MGVDELALQRAKRALEAKIKEALSSLIGEPVDEKMTKEIVLDNLKDLLPTGNLNADEHKALAEFVSVSFLGIPVGFDPKDLFTRIRTSTLDEIIAPFPPDYDLSFPLNLFQFERLKRMDMLSDWSFKRLSKKDADIHIHPKVALDFIGIELKEPHPHEDAEVFTMPEEEPPDAA